MPIFYGLESLQRADWVRIGFGIERCPVDDQPIACRDCCEKKPVQLSGEVETDEVHIRAGHKGHPAIVASENRKGRRRKLKGKRGRGTLVEEKPPVLGMIQRNGEVVIHMLPNVQQVTIQPLMTVTIQTGSLIYTDEYNIYDRLEQWGLPT
jgi:hypothetical protein